MRNHHDIALDHAVGIDFEQNPLNQVHVAIKNALHTVLEGDLQHRVGIIEVTLAVFLIAEVPVGAAQVVVSNRHTVLDGGIVGDQLALFVGQIPVLMGEHHIKAHTVNGEGLTGVGLVVAHVGIEAADQLHHIVDIPGGIGPLDINIVHDVLQIEVVVELIDEPGEAQVMVSMRVGQKPGVDHHLLVGAGGSGQLTAECQELFAGIVAPLLDIAAVIDKQTVVGHANHNQRTAVSAALAIRGGGELGVITVAGHRQAIHSQHGGGHMLACLIVEALHRIFLGIHNDTGLLIEGEVVGVELVASVGGSEAGKTVGFLRIIGGDLHHLIILQCVAALLQLLHIGEEFRGIRVGDDGQVRLGAIVGDAVAAVIRHGLGDAAGGRICGNRNLFGKNDVRCLDKQGGVQRHSDIGRIRFAAFRIGFAGFILRRHGFLRGRGGCFRSCLGTARDSGCRGFLCFRCKGGCRNHGHQHRCAQQQRKERSESFRDVVLHINLLHSVRH